MCGIFGIIADHSSGASANHIKKTLFRLATRSISRGKDSSGICFKRYDLRELKVIKGDIPVTELLEAREFKDELYDALSQYQRQGRFIAMGHARLVTNGSQLNAENNQPVIKGHFTGIHNGIIVNDDQLWAANPSLKREYRIDTEVVLAMLDEHHQKTGDMAASVRCVMSSIKGTASLALVNDNFHLFTLTSNNGSLYFMAGKGLLIFASELSYLNDLPKQIERMLDAPEQLQNGDMYFLDTESFLGTTLKSESSDSYVTDHSVHPPFKTTVADLRGHFRNEIVVDPSKFIRRSDESHLFRLLESDLEGVSKLKRCAKCILPETFPFIDFDSFNVCNYCRNFRPLKKQKSLDSLQALVNPYRRRDRKPDCIVPFSGGRDSTFTLHVAKKELGLNPIAFTYDWGMVTDLARRNISRVCGNLGVEHIVVAADIHRKRANIRKNLLPWLKKPSLGMVPLFMAGDKYFFYHCSRLQKQTGIDLNIWGINDLENTDFKTGFAGVAPRFDKKRIYSLSLRNQLTLFSFVLKNVVASPGYLNQSIPDSLGSFAARYFAPKHDYFHLFDYYRWNETEIETLIRNEYGWELAIDTNSTWRIGDGTASFYNYIYYTVAGFTENDTFRSNQIRAGLITREQALLKAQLENQPRYETLRWYLQIIGLDFTDVISKINRIPRLYQP